MAIVVGPKRDPQIPVTGSTTPPFPKNVNIRRKGDAKDISRSGVAYGKKLMGG
jgi:hypothetical protein